MLYRIVAISFLLHSVGVFLAANGCSSASSRDELEALWGELLREERYEIVAFHRASSKPMVVPTDDQTLVVEDRRGAYLWGLWGVSGGGGWQIRGRLEEELSISNGVIQLYSKSSKKWSPGFLFYEGGYNTEKYPAWRFLLIFRDGTNRKQIETLWATEVGPEAVVPATQPGERHPSGKLRYDPGERTATVTILGVKDPITAEVPIP